jgi:Immunoglobulin I-set domain
MKIWWTFNEDGDNVGQNLTTSDGILVTRNTQKVSMLAIDAVKARHRGNYTCFASNKGGVAHHSAYLAINGSIFVTLYESFSKFAICFHRCFIKNVQ